MLLAHCLILILSIINGGTLFAIAQSFVPGTDCSNPMATTLFTSDSGVIYSMSDVTYNLIMNETGPFSDTLCYLNDILSETCYLNCIVNGDGSCTGDSDFCNSTSCDPASVCFCGTKYFIQVIEDTEGRVINGTVNIPLCFNAGSDQVLAVQGLLGQRRRAGGGGGGPPSYETVYSSKLEGYTYDLIFSGNGMKQIFLYKDGLQQSETLVGYHAVVTLKQDFFISSGILDVAIYQNGFLIFDDSIDLVGISYVKVYDCIFCSEFFTSFSKMPRSVQITGVIVFMALFGGAVWIFLAYLYLFKELFLILIYLFMLIWKGIKWVYCKVFKEPYGKLREKALEKNLNGSTTEGSSNFEKKDVEYAGEPVKKKKKSLGLGGYFALATLAGASGTNGLAPLGSCDFSAVMPYTSQICITNPDSTISCSIAASFQTTLPYLGSTTCIDLVNGDGGDSGFSLRLTYNSSGLSYGMTDIYYTSDWEYYYKNSKQCSTLGSGDCASGCDRVNPFDKTARGHINDAQIKNWPGRAACHKAQGCSHNGCVSCGTVCFWESYSIIPNGLKAKVMKIGQQIFNPCVTVEYWSGREMVYSEIICASQRLSVYGNFTTVIQGAYAFAPPALPKTHIAIPSGCQAEDFCYNQEVAAFVAASEVNFPQQGLVGDVQASDPNNFLVGGVNAFTFDPNVYNGNGNFDPSGVTNAGTTATPIPYSSPTGDWLFDYTANNLYSTNYQVGGLVVTMSTNQPVTYVQDVSAVCPDMTFVSITGCSQCDTGASFAFTALTTCGSGGLVQASLDCGSSSITQSNFAVILTANPETYYINFIANNPGDITCTATLSFSIFDLSFSASDSGSGTLLTPDQVNEVMLENTDGTRVYSTESSDALGFFKSSDISANLANLRDNILGFKGGPLQSFIGVLMYIGIIIGAYLVVMVLMRLWSMRSPNAKAGKTA